MTHSSVPADQRELLGISDTAVSYDLKICSLCTICAVCLVGKHERRNLHVLYTLV
jgi:hypothetical protein